MSATPPRRPAGAHRPAAVRRRWRATRRDVRPHRRESWTRWVGGWWGLLPVAVFVVALCWLLVLRIVDPPPGERYVPSFPTRSTPVAPLTGTPPATTRTERPSATPTPSCTGTRK